MKDKLRKISEKSSSEIGKREDLLKTDKRAKKVRQNVEKNIKAEI